MKLKSKQKTDRNYHFLKEIFIFNLKMRLFYLMILNTLHIINRMLLHKMYTFLEKCI